MFRTVILWVVLVGLFIGFYQLFSAGGGAGVLVSSLASAWLPAIFLGFFFIFFVVLIRRQRGAYREHNAAHTQLAEGRVLEALASFEAARKKMKNPIPVMNVGYSQLLLWRVADAVVNLEEFAKKSSALNGVPGGDKLVAPSAALANALLGNAAAANGWIAKAPGPAPSKLAGVVLLARAENFAEAERQLQANEVVLDQLGGTLRAFAETLSAYVASKTGGQGGAVDPVRMFRESSVDALKPVWPELHAFILRAAQVSSLSPL